MSLFLLTKCLRYFVKNIDFGAVQYEGKTYTLTDWAEPSSRLLPYPKNIHEVEEGEEYDFEMIAPAVDDEGNEYSVCIILNDDLTTRRRQATGAVFCPCHRQRGRSSQRVV